MGVHRIDANAERKLREMLAKDEKPGAFISQLIRDYYAGLGFNRPE